MYARLIPVAALLALAGCKDEVKTDGRSAQGEILPAAVSDAMLPLDSVRSMPPLAEKGAGSTEEDAAKPGAKPSAAAKR